MSIRNSIAFVVATLITAGGMAGIVSYTNAGADAVQANTRATAATVTVLPEITVRPVSATFRKPETSATDDGASQASSTASARMPYYSFAADRTGT
jgi:hypothetical protein